MDSLATYASAGIRRTLQAYLTTKARLRSKAFFCNSLAGNSDINLCVNSDLTVSCTCHDIDASGHIGDLREQSVEQILDGPTARRFREMLAEGRLPTPLCTRCCDLRMINRNQAAKLVDMYHTPDFMMVENTSACNLRCLSCPREKIRQIRSKVSMSLDEVRRVAIELNAAGVKRIAYLNQGEPFLSKNIRRELEILREVNPSFWINTSTNGQYIDSDDKREAALLMDRIHISLDGVDQRMVNRYQRGLDFEAVYHNMKALVEYRDARGRRSPTIIWKYLLFRWTESRRHVLRAVEMARAAGVDRIEFDKTVSPFYGMPIRSYLGWLKGIGEQVDGDRCVVFRADTRKTVAETQRNDSEAEVVATDV